MTSNSFGDKQPQYAYALRVEKVIQKNNGLLESHGVGNWLRWLCYAETEFLNYIENRSAYTVHSLNIIYILLDRESESSDWKKDPSISKQLREKSSAEMLQTLLKPCPDGLFEGIEKLSSGVWEATSYELFLELVSIDAATELFKNVPEITPVFLRAMNSIDSCYWGMPILLCLNTVFKVNAFTFYIMAIEKGVPGDELEVIIDSLSTVETFRNLPVWFAHNVSSYFWPIPPWQGNENIVPVETAKDLEQVLPEYKSDVGLYVHRIISGHTFCYGGRGPYSGIYIELLQDSYLGWYVSEINYCGQAILEKSVRKSVVAEFVGQGFIARPEEYFPNYYGLLDTRIYEDEYGN